ncbi:MAG: ATP-NAD kinase family protein [Pseudomonadales bacterium]
MKNTRDELRVGLLINPVAGLGGAVGLKGSDGAEIQALARAKGGQARGQARAIRFLQTCYLTALPESAAELCWFGWGGEMGADAFARAQRSFGPEGLTVLGQPSVPSSAADTQNAARALAAAGIDLLVFVGGDGTARDLFDVLGSEVLVLGVPAGVKMHSGVFATTPESAAAVVRGLATGGIVSARMAPVTDLDEAMRLKGELQTRTYGEMRIPESGSFLQHTKEGGRENESLVLEEIVAWLQEQLSGQVVLGPGSSCARVKEALGMQPTLLGVDVWDDGRQSGTDVDAQWLARNAQNPTALVVSFTRGQGFLFGRGNQQFVAEWLREIPREAILIISSRSKLTGLQGRPLLVDTDDPAFNRVLSGLHRVVVGYDDELWYRIATHG